MRRGFTVNTVANDGEYAYTDCTDTTTSIAIARFARWYKGRYDWKCYLQSSGVGGEYFLQWVDWEAFKREYRFGTQTSGQPKYVSMDPSQKFVLGPKPSAVYVVSGDYQLGPQTLAADADTPEMPSRFHSVITYRALVKYGFNSVAPEALQRASIEGGRLHAALVRDQRPPITAGCSLA